MYWYIHGKAYDLTPYLDKHPGGRYILESVRGLDATALFESYHRSTNNRAIYNIMEKYRVDAPALLPTYDWDHTPIYDDILDVVLRYKKEHGLKATWATWAWYGFLGVLHHVFLWHWILGTGGWIVPVCLGLTMWFWCGALLHDGTHYSFCDRPEWSRRIGAWCGWLFVLPSLWVKQHVVAHHTHTNHEHRDPDLHHYDNVVKNRTPFVSWYSTTERDTFGFGNLTRMISIPRSVYWLVPGAVVTNVILSLTYVPILLESNRCFGTGELLAWPRHEKVWAWAQWTMFVLFLAGMGYVRGVAWAFLPFAVCGNVFYACSQVSHVNAPSQELDKCREWAHAQILACQGDYSYGSAIANALSIGLNNQTIHHLFPSIHPCHFPALARRLKPVWKKHALPLSGWTQSYRDSFVAHVAHLRACTDEKKIQ